jgi:Putative neutral zinc metallopeptidase
VTRPLLLGLALILTGLGFTGAADQRQPLLARMGTAPEADPEKPPPTRPCPDPPCFDPSLGRTPTAYLNWVGRDVSEFWRKRVSRIPTVRWLRGRQLVIPPGKRYRSVCYRDGVTSKTPLSYCAKDPAPTVILPLDSARVLILRQKTWTNWRKKDFALAYVVAHEWAHHLQKVLDLLRDRELRAIKIELQADCLAGYWAYSTWARQLLDPGDIREAVTLARLVGDAPGSPKNDRNAHGSAAQREAWFERGFANGDPSRCIVD